ncbi:beta-galactosidase [Streptomyces sp. NEAU-174]|uniref:beta-galactosidase n=1 Tax=Streptomyces sp. NEAU-174 TaxID=3458254 RepID=UPI0040447AED
MKLARVGQLRTALAGTLAAVLLAVLSAAVPAHATVPGAAATKATPHTVSYDKYSVKVDGRRLFVWSGEFHYWRLPSPDLWRDVLQKIKASGMNAVSIYFDWGFHSPAKGHYDFTGVHDVDKLLDMAEQAGLYVIARPGPYINAETDGGGFPGWLMTQKGQARSTDPEYLAAAREWLRKIDRILARRQVTDGTGPVLLYQVENELYDPDGRNYIVELSKQVRADGITVPLVGNEPMPQYAGGEGLDFVGELDQYNSFCKGEWWLPALKRQQDDAPLAIFEAGTGWFQTWGDTGYDKCREKMGPAYQKIVNKHEVMQGTTIENLYMAYGGTNWGWLADPRQVYTSYDYGAPISESRQTGADYDEMKRQGLFYTTTGPLTTTDPAEAPASSNGAVHIEARANPHTDTQFLYLRHGDPMADADATTTFDWKTPYGTYPVTARLNGKTGKILVAGHDLGGGQRLVYSTSELLTSTGTGDRTRAVLYGGEGDPGQTMLRYPAEPKVTVLDGKASATWDAKRGDLKLDYTHSGLTRVLLQGGGRPELLLLIGTDDEAAGFWRQETKAGPVLEHGTELVRTASVTGRTLALTGDARKAGPLEVFAPPGVRSVTWNGLPLKVKPTASGSLRGTVPGPKGVPLPELTGWRTSTGNPEAAPDFDDSSWTYADKLTTDNPTAPGTLPVLYQDEYGYHYGYVWYRGRFKATGTEKSLTLAANATNPETSSGAVGAYSVWINGEFAGTSRTGRHTFPLPRGILRADGKNTIAIASWSEDTKSGGLGKVDLTTLGNVTSSLRVPDVAAPAYDAANYTDPAAPARVTIDAPDTVEPGGSYQVTASVSVPEEGKSLRDLTLSPDLPDSWIATPADPVRLGTLEPGASASARWTLSVPSAQKAGTAAIVGATADFIRRGKPGRAAGEEVVAAQPPPLTAGEHYVSDLPFQSSSNGWGAVERDQSNGENAGGDGLPLTLHDTGYEKGLGTHAASSVQVWLGGTCTTFHAALGLDQETYGRSDGPATVTYTVLADGMPVYESGAVDRDTATKKIDVDVADARRLELIVSDAGDGNALDHADWADAKLTCGGGG